MVHYKIEDFELVKYYSYTTQVLDRICSYHKEFGRDGSDEERMATHVQTFFKSLCDAAVSVERHNFEDNKCCFKIRHKKSGKEIFVGQYDWSFSIGLSCRQLFGREFDFEKKEWSDYKSEDYNRELEF